MSNKFYIVIEPDESYAKIRCAGVDAENKELNLEEWKEEFESHIVPYVNQLASMLLNDKMPPTYSFGFINEHNYVKRIKGEENE